MFLHAPVEHSHEHDGDLGGVVNCRPVVVGQLHVGPVADNVEEKDDHDEEADNGDFRSIVVQAQKQADCCSLDKQEHAVSFEDISLPKGCVVLLVVVFVSGRHQQNNKRDSGQCQNHKEDVECRQLAILNAETKGEEHVV